MKKCIACVGALMILSSSAFGDWWDGLDWEEVSTTAAGNFSALYAQNSENWLYLRVDLDTVWTPVGKWHETGGLKTERAFGLFFGVLMVCVFFPSFDSCSPR